MKQAPEAGEILSAIDQVKKHKIFNRSPLMCAFLSYVTIETIQGRESRISAYSVAVDALGKPTDFDPQMDPSVRVLAKRLRDSLARYYDESSDYDICVVLKPGSYIPSFYRAEPNTPVNSTTELATDCAASSTANNTVGDPNKKAEKTLTASTGSWSSPVLRFLAVDLVARSDQHLDNFAIGFSVYRGFHLHRFDR